MSKYSKIFLRKFIALMTVFALMVMSCPLTAFAIDGSGSASSGDSSSTGSTAASDIQIGVDTFPDIDILLTQGQTSMNLSNFKNDIKHALSELGCSSAKVKIEASGSDAAQSDGSFKWTKYSRIRADCGDTYKDARGGAPLSNGRSGTIYLDDRGSYSNVCFYGNWVRAGSLIMYAPVPSPPAGYIVNEQTTTFDYSLSFGDSISGAGYIINAYEEGGYLKGYMLILRNLNRYNQSVQGTQLDTGNKNIGIFKFEYPLEGIAKQGYYVKTDSSFYWCKSMSLVSSTNLPSYTGKLQVTRKENTVYVYNQAYVGNTYKSKTEVFRFNLNKIGDKFGYCMFNYEHGCSSLGYFELKNLKTSTNSRIPYSKVLTNNAAILQDNDLQFIVNVDDTIDPTLTDLGVVSLTNASTGLDGLHFVGWGKDNVNKSTMNTFLNITSTLVSGSERAQLGSSLPAGYYTDTDGSLRRQRGLYLSQSHGYTALINSTARYIYNMALKYANRDNVVIENKAALTIEPASKARNSAVSPGKYAYGKWTVNHYGKTYTGNNATNAQLYGGKDLIEADGTSLADVRPHTVTVSRYHTPTRQGQFKNVLIGTKSVDSQIYKDARGYKYTHDLVDDVYRNYPSGSVGTPSGGLVGTVKTGETLRNMVTDYEKSFDTISVSEDAIAGNLELVGTYIVFSDIGAFSSQGSWVGCQLEGNGMRVQAYELVDDEEKHVETRSWKLYSAADNAVSSLKENITASKPWWYDLFPSEDEEDEDGEYIFEDVNSDVFHQYSVKVRADGTVRGRGPVQMGNIRPVVDPFKAVNPDTGEVEDARNYVFIARGCQIDGREPLNEDGTSQKRPFGIGKFSMDSDDNGSYESSTEFQPFQLLDVYKVVDHYTIVPIRSNVLVDLYDPIIQTNVPVYGDKVMAYRYDNDLSLYNGSTPLVADEPGLYEIYYEDQILKTIYVHRRPHAEFQLSLGAVQYQGQTPMSSLSYINKSYDLDHFYTDGVTDSGTRIPGIVSCTWEWRKDGDFHWHQGKLSSRIDRSIKYEIRLTVEDREGEKSSASIVIGDGYSSPVAKFSLMGTDVSVDATGNKSVESNKKLSYDDSSYDPNGFSLTQYSWSVQYREPNGKNFVTISSGLTSFPSSLTRGAGTYIYTLKVKNSAGKWSDVASDTITAVHPKVTLTFDKNVSSAEQYGSTSEKVLTNSYYDIDDSVNYCRRIGWDFEGWGASYNVKKVYGHYYEVQSDTVTNELYRLYIGSGNTTIYAIYKRWMTLVLAKDDIGHLPAYSYKGEIWNRETEFNWSHNNIATHRDPVSYTVTFMDNDSDEAESVISNSGKTDSSTELLANDTIIATRTFDGWYEQLSREKIGGNDTDIKDVPKEGTISDHVLSGNMKSIQYDDSQTKTICLLPEYHMAYIKLPGCSRNVGVSDLNGREQDKFIGWFTEPQTDPGSFSFGGQYYGYTGDIVPIDEDVTLYPWFNTAPKVVRSKLGETSCFYEGQTVTYDQLLAFIDASDVDNPAETGIEGNIKYSGLSGWMGLDPVKAWMGLYECNAREYLDLLDEENGWHLTDEAKNEVLSHVNTDLFNPQVTGITYMQDGKDSDGEQYPINEPDNKHDQSKAEILSEGVLTDASNVGKIIVHYDIEDNGTFVDCLKVAIGSSPNWVRVDGDTYDVDSEIKVGFDLEMDIRFNDLPIPKLRSTYMYADDSDIGTGSIEYWLWEKQDATDVEDDYDRTPWWYASETGPALDASLKVIRVYDIQFSSGYEIDQPERCEDIRKIDTLVKLWLLKDTDYDAFSHITSFKVEWDCADQWGKTASGYAFPVAGTEDGARNELPGGQSRYGLNQAERSMEVIMVNNLDDAELLDSTVSVHGDVRYIDSTWLGYLDDKSYWGSTKYGKNKLNEIFKKYDNRGASWLSLGSYDKNGSSVQVTVNDYSN